MNRNRDHKGIEILLENYNILKSNIDNMRIELKEISMESGLGPITYEQESVSKTNKITSITEDTAIRNIKYSDLLEKRIEITQSKIKRIDNALNQLCELEREIIEEKDIKIKSWDEITSDLPCSFSTARRIRKKALDKMAISIFGDIKFKSIKNEEVYC